jgi:hypothetical protein
MPTTTSLGIRTLPNLSRALRLSRLLEKYPIVAELDLIPLGVLRRSYLGVGAGFMHQRLYKTTDTLNTAVLPLSAQFSYLSGEHSGVPSKMIWYALLGYMPALTETHAYQLSGIAGVLIPTKLSLAER